MFGSMRYVFWIIIFVALNYSAIPYALELYNNGNDILPFGEYASAVMMALVNISVCQLFIAIRIQFAKFYLFGLYAAMGMIVSFLVLAQLQSVLPFKIVFSICALASFILLITQMILHKKMTRKQKAA